MGIRRMVRQQISLLKEAFRAEIHKGADIESLKGEIMSLRDELSRANGQIGQLIEHPLLKRKHDSYNVLAVAEFYAAIESAKYYGDCLLTARAYESDEDLLINAVSRARPGGLFLEFGVASGRTATCIANHIGGTLYAFDVFEGLPEDWRTGYPQGHFAGAVPQIPDNVEIVKGLFSETLPEFVLEHGKFVSFAHIDCDLYSSTKDIFSNLGSLLVPGSVIVFDEYMNYPGWKSHEYQAFQEFVEENRIEYTYDAFVPSHQQVCITITNMN